MPIIGLGNSTEVGSKGYLCFTKTRNGNDAFYRWFANEIVVPFILLVRGIYDPRVLFFNFSFIITTIFYIYLHTLCTKQNDDGTPMRAFVMCDGEEAQIRFFQEPEIQRKFKEALIDFGKSFDWLWEDSCIL